MSSRTAIAVGVSVVVHVALALLLPTGTASRTASQDEPPVTTVAIELIPLPAPRDPEHEGASEGVTGDAPASGGAGDRRDASERRGTAEHTDAHAGGGSVSSAYTGSKTGDGIGTFDPHKPMFPPYDPTPTPAPGPFDNGLRPKPRKPKVLGKNTDEGPYVARTRLDGKVELDDKPNVGINLPRARDIGRHLESWAKDPYGTSRSTPRVSVTSPDGETVETFQILGGGFDLTDALMRRTGQDPYSAKKLGFMDRTRDERGRMARVEQSEQLRDSLPALTRDVARVWSSALPASERRALLFAMWDECAETGSANVVAAANQARATIIAFIQRTLPLGTANAYTPDELRRLNSRRTSRHRFSPYARRK